MISSITKGPRQSNIELLRILAMFLVLVVHADFWSLGAPNLEEYRLNPVPSITRSMIQCCAIVCVNIFICISGWFGIKPSIKGLMTFIFQSIFIVCITFVFAIISAKVPFSLYGIRQCLLLDSSLWFIKAYIGLYILSPLLNTYTEYANKGQFLSVLIPFYIFQSIWGILGAAPFIMNGYSVFSFVGLYLLARFIRIYGTKHKHILKIIGILSLIANMILYIFPRLLGYIPPELFLTYEVVSTN